MDDYSDVGHDGTMIRARRFCCLEHNTLETTAEATRACGGSARDVKMTSFIGVPVLVCVGSCDRLTVHTGWNSFYSSTREASRAG
jgi:hypothetical protein